MKILSMKRFALASICVFALSMNAFAAKVVKAHPAKVAQTKAAKTIKREIKAKTRTSVKAKAVASLIQVDFDHAKGATLFRAVGHPSAIRIDGKGSCPKGVLSWSSDGKVTGDLTMDLNSFDTGISMRNHHMKEKYLETGKYPDSKLTFTDLVLPDESSGKDFSQDGVPFKGMLTLHGVTRPVSGTAKIQRTGNSATVDARFQIKISDYKIAVPSFAGITVADEVNLTVDATAPLVGTKKL